MAVHRTQPEGWLIPAALGVLVVCVLFATTMLIWRGGAPAKAAVPVLPTNAPASGVSLAPSAAQPTAAHPPAGAGVVIHSVNSNGLCVDVRDGDNPTGAALVQQPCSGAPRQTWREQPGANGAVTLVNAASGLCIDVNGASNDDGARVQQWTCNGADNQLWKLVDAGNGTVSLVSVHSGKCLDTPDRKTDPGTKLQQFHCNGTVAQQWKVS